MLLFCDGFDHYATADFLTKYDAINASNQSTISVGNGRFGGNCFLMGASANVGTCQKFIPTLTTLIYGFAFKLNSSSDVLLMGASDNDVAETAIKYVASTNNLSLLRNASNTVNSAIVSIATGVWHYLEVKVALTVGATGSYEVRLNGINVLSGSGVITGGAGSVNRFGVGGHRTSLSGNGVSIDDVYLCDTTGSQNNDFLGDIRIDTIYPTADGANSAWTLSTGTDHFGVVDESTPNADTDYSYTQTVSARDTMAAGDISLTGGTVKAVVVNATARKDGGVRRGLKGTVKSSASYGLGTEYNLTEQYHTAQSVIELDPNGSIAWTETSVNAIEIGMDLTT